MDIIRRIAAILAGIGEGFVGGLFRGLWEGLTGRNLAAEQAEHEDARERELAAQAQHDELEARHDETIAAAATQAEEMRALRLELREMTERRVRQELIRRSHETPPPEADETDDARPSRRRWRRRDEDPEDGAPLFPVPV